jgi:hypothetical protein
MENIITEIFGYIGLILALLALTFKDDKYFKVTQTLSSLFFAIHFLLLDSYIGAITCGLGFISLSIAIWKNNRKINNIFFGIYVLLLLFTIYTFEIEKWYEILPAINNIFWCIGFLYMTGQKTNMMLIPVIFLWIIYAICVGSIPNLVTQIAVLIFLLTRIIRLNNENKKRISL